ncbi:preprotein translocase subunit YajC [Candidatus Tachikawaea gelatinosa]|uniref:Sec translocon accessory complex subunit YajC n=1 Tax=Candidatus Tachikawaea gelatinosa TaxID=1410383 RepID=A0A090ASA0_9ENTR|nr:preprotein translocase subunit YajC [Candidatus Tachikawaea gelatinosa]BAP58750.1 preprotein translocase subunit YajC [Candidatus Tachikawaea gelatinosa]
MSNIHSTDQSNPYSLILILILFGVTFYFVVFLPQKKRLNEQKKVIDSIVEGDEIITTSGLLGRVVNIKKTGYISIALNEKTEVVIKRDFIASILPKGTINEL